MRRILAYFLGTFLLLSLGVLVQDPSFTALADWLGPLLGSHIYTMLTIIFLLMANPLKYIAVSLVWIISGFLTGVLVGKKTAAILISILVWFTLLPILGASIYGVYTSLDARNMFTSEPLEAINSIPVVPVNLDFNHLFNVPIFTDLVLRAAENIPNLEESTNPIGILLDLITPLTLAIASKPLILLVGALAGSFFSEPIKESALEVWSQRNKVISIIILGIIISTTVTKTNAINIFDGVYVEALEAYTDKQGRVLSGLLAIGSGIENISLGPYETDGLLAAAIITQKIYDPRVLYTLNLSDASDFIHFINLLPNTFAFTVYTDEDTGNTQDKSRKIIDKYQQIYGIEFQEIVSIPVSTEEALPPLIVTIYYSLYTLEETTQSITKGLTVTKGFAKSLQEKIDKGSHQDLELYASGIFQPKVFEDYLTQEIPPFYREIVTPLFGLTYSFLAEVQLSEYGVQQQGNGYVLDLEKLFDLDSTPTYARDTDGSFILLARSNQTGPEDSATVFMTTSLPENSPELTFVLQYLSPLGLMEVQSKSPTSTETRILIPEIKGQKASITKTSRVKDGETEISIKITNNGDQTIRKLQLVDTFPVKYDILMDETSQSEWSQLEPDKSVTYNYSVEFVNPGVYTDLPAVLSYEIGDVELTAVSNTLDPIDKNVNLLTLIKDNLKAMMGLINTVI